MQNAFFFAVLARDLGVLWGEDVFNDRLCAMMGENAKEGLRDLLPSIAGVRGRKWADKLQLLTSWLWEQQCAHQPAGLLEWEFESPCSLENIMLASGCSSIVAPALPAEHPRGRGGPTASCAGFGAQQGLFL